MRTILEVFGILIGAFLSFRLGWAAPVFYLALILVMCGLRIFSFTKSPTFNAHLCFSLAAFSFAALFAAWFLNEVLTCALANDPELLSRHAATRSLMGTAALRYFWVVLGGLLIALILGAAFLAPAVANGRMLYGADAQNQGQAWQATKSALKDIIGLNKRIWVGNNGDSQVVSSQPDSLAALGGPATLTVQDGYAAILERAGQLRMVGRGVYQLAANERVAMTVPLFVQSEHLEIPDVVTADQISIELLELWALHEVSASVRDAANPLDDAALRDWVRAINGRDWHNSVRDAVVPVTREIVGQHTLEEIRPLAGGNLKTELTEAINHVTHDSMRVDVMAVNFGEVRIPADVRDRLQEQTMAEWGAQAPHAQTTEAQMSTNADVVKRFLGFVEQMDVDPNQQFKMLTVLLELWRRILRRAAA